MSRLAGVRTMKLPAIPESTPRRGPCNKYSGHAAGHFVLSKESRQSLNARCPKRRGISRAKRQGRKAAKAICLLPVSLHRRWHIRIYGLAAWRTRVTATALSALQTMRYRIACKTRYQPVRCDFSWAGLTPAGHLSACPGAHYGTSCSTVSTATRLLRNGTRRRTRRVA
jgi:hypothetical protein